MITPLTSESYFADSYTFAPADVDGRAIARSLATLASADSWLDLGCGPILTVWAIFARGPRELVGLDCLRENIEFTKDLCTTRRIARQHQMAADFAATDLELPPLGEEALAECAFGRVRSLRVGNVLDDVPEWHSHFDLVTQIGCFGCLQEPAEVVTAARNALRYLRPQGAYLSVTWLQDVFEDLLAWNGPVSAQLSADDLVAVHQEAGFSDIRRSICPTADPIYREIIILTARKR
jgi:SAM-dependent methyltransferase